MIRSATIIMFALLLSACHTMPISKPVTTIDLQNGFVDHFSSQDGVFKRAMCPQSKSVWVPVRLSESELHKIASIAVSSGFFELPDQLESFGSDMDKKRGVIKTIAPCADFSLKIYYGPMNRTVKWQCATDGGSNDPVQVSELTSYIRHVVYAKSQVEALPRTNCSQR